MIPGRRLVVARHALCLVALVGCGGKAPRKPDRGALEGTLVVTSSPTGAAVLLEGRARLGTTPLTLRRPDGARVSLELIKDGYQVLRRTELVEGGVRREVQVALRLEELPLVVSSGVVRGARILVDGEATGTTPDRLSMPVGRHRVAVEKAGYHPFRQSLEVRTGTSPKVEADLVPIRPRLPAPGWLSVTVDLPAEVRLDGRRVGEAPVERLRLLPRSYRLTVVALKEDHGGREERTLIVRPHEHEQVEVRFNGGAPPAADPAAKGREPR